MQNRTCPKCGHQNPLTTTQCEKCGTALSAATSQKPTEPQASSLDATIEIPDFEFDETIIPQLLDTLESTPAPVATAGAESNTQDAGESTPAAADATVARPEPPDNGISIPAPTDVRGEKLTSDATIPTRPDFKLVKPPVPDAGESAPVSTDTVVKQSAVASDQPAAPPMPAVVESAAPADASVASTDVPAVGENMPAPRVSTREIDNPVEEDRELGMGNVRMLGDLILKEEESGTQFNVPHEQLQEVVIGRMNRETNYMPTIDLTELGGHEKGVSRRHATISNRDNLLVITDHTSLNGTFLNGQRLVPEQPRVVRDKDTIRIGAITLEVGYEGAEETTSYRPEL